MKKLLLFIMLSLSLLSFSQYSVDSPILLNKDIDLKLNMLSSTSPTRYGEPSLPLGPSMMIGGAAFVVAGLLTVPDYDVLEDGTTQTKPFWRQGARMLAIVTGGGLFTAGIIISLN